MLPPDKNMFARRHYSRTYISNAVELCSSVIRRFEGLYLSPYLCPAGRPTIFYGATFYQNGTGVTLSDPRGTREQAEDLLQFMLSSVFIPGVQKLCPNIEHPEQLAAITDFAFNLGIGRLKASTLRKRINAGDWEAVPGELRKWTKGGGRTLRGLVARREAEILLLGTA